VTHRLEDTPCRLKEKRSCETLWRNRTPSGPT
jgi:hypothetical protein